MPTVPFTDAQTTSILRYCGYPARAAYGFIIGGEDMATTIAQINAMSDAEQAVVVTTFLPNLATLEAAIPAATVTLYVAQAGPFTRNPDEVDDRIAQYSWLRRQLCAFIGVTPGEGLRGGASGRLIRT